MTDKYLELKRLAKELDAVAIPCQDEMYSRMQHGGTSEESQLWFNLCELRDALRPFLPPDDTYQKAEK